MITVHANVWVILWIPIFIAMWGSIIFFVPRWAHRQGRRSPSRR